MFGSQLPVDKTTKLGTFNVKIIRVNLKNINGKCITESSFAFFLQLQFQV
jgi:hypothetical protein